LIVYADVWLHPCTEVNASNSAGNLKGLMSGAQGFKDVDIDTHMSEYRKTVACVPGVVEGENCIKEAANANNNKSMCMTCGQRSSCEVLTRSHIRALFACK
jgi:hypothetical protein